MTPEHLTNEELAEWTEKTLGAIAIQQEFVGRYDLAKETKAKAHEAARRLRNSIPKPRVEVTGRYVEGGTFYQVNGELFWADLDGSDIKFFQALGIELIEDKNGGGDE